VSGAVGATFEAQLAVCKVYEAQQLKIRNEHTFFLLLRNTLLSWPIKGMFVRSILTVIALPTFFQLLLCTTIFEIPSFALVFSSTNEGKNVTKRKKN
jgi:hypothetical protein